jgi:hypothetical protein
LRLPYKTQLELTCCHSYTLTKPALTCKMQTSHTNPLIYLFIHAVGQHTAYVKFAGGTCFATIIAKTHRTRGASSPCVCVCVAFGLARHKGNAQRALAWRARGMNQQCVLHQRERRTQKHRLCVLSRPI